MADTFSPDVRSRVMSRIRSKDTSPELILRKALWNRGYRYRIHYKLPGTPDIVFIGKKVAVFIDGCFWHKCPKCYVEPKSNLEYWLPKLERNAEKDKMNNDALGKKGWNVIRIWEHEIKEDVEKSIQAIIEVITSVDRKR